MVKSLYGFEREKERRYFQSESIQNFITIEACILEVISTYKKMREIDANRYAALKKLLKGDISVQSGVNFIVVTEDEEYGVISSPYSEDELRSIFGSDDNIRGRIILFDVLERNNLPLSAAKNVRFKGSSGEQVVNLEEAIPITVAGMFSRHTSSNVKMRRFRGE